MSKNGSAIQNLDSVEKHSNLKRKKEFLLPESILDPVRYANPKDSVIAIEIRKLFFIRFDDNKIECVRVCVCVYKGAFFYQYIFPK